MAEINYQVSVSVEAAIHDGLRDFAQTVFDEYGVRINSASLQWVDLSTPEKHQMVVTDISLDTVTRHPFAPK